MWQNGSEKWLVNLCNGSVKQRIFCTVLFMKDVLYSTYGKQNTAYKAGLVNIRGMPLIRRPTKQLESILDKRDTEYLV